MNRKIRLIKGASYTSKGIHATKKEPETVVDEATAEKAVASGFFKYVDEPATEEIHFAPAEKEDSGAVAGEQNDEKDALEGMTYSQLKELAAQMGINTKGLKNKASLVAAINEATEVEPVVVSETMLHLQER